MEDEKNYIQNIMLKDKWNYIFSCSVWNQCEPKPDGLRIALLKSKPLNKSFILLGLGVRSYFITWPLVLPS